MRKIRAGLLGLAFALAASALALPGKVFVFNDNKDRTNQFAKNYIWQELGLMDANGQPGTVQPNGDIMVGGNKVGEVIKNGAGQVVGYKNADGSQEAYDVDKATTNEAWMRVANDGCLVIMKHGGGRDGTTGGGIHLDNSQTYDGFGQGTGAGFRNNRNKNQSGAYPLTPRPGANIKITLYVCNGGTDPDGGGPKKSVGESAGTVPGVGSVESWPRKLAGTVTWSFKQGDINQQRAALRILRKMAKEAGFSNAKTDLDDAGLTSWMMSLSANDRYKIVNDAIASTGACIGFRYSTNPPVWLQDDVDAFEPVHQYTPGVPGVYTISPPIPELSMALVIDPGDLALPELFQIDKLSAEVPPPIGRWATAAWDVREMEFEPFTPGPLEYRLQYAGNPSLARPMQFDSAMGAWVPVPGGFFSGGAFVFRIHGPRIVAVAEDCRRVPVVSMAAAQGALLEGGVWDPADSDLDATLAAGPPAPGPKRSAAVLEVVYDGSAPATLFDVRGVFGVNTPAGVLQVQAKNPGTGQFDTLGTFTATEARTAFRLENLPGGVYLDASRRLVLRYRAVMAGPFVLPSQATLTLPGCQVTLHD